MNNVRKELVCLAKYLVAHGASIKLLGVSLEHDPGQDRENLRDPRAFCHVKPDDPGTIFCSAALAELRAPARIAVLLHELGHIELNAFTGDTSEVDVDAWCMEWPDAHYTYMDAVYWRADVRKPVTAKNLKHVSYAFVDKIHE